MIPIEDFKIVVENTPLISIDFIIKDIDTQEILLGKRINKPAFGYYFTLGGRVLKNETLLNAKKRIFRNELGIELDNNLNFLGIFEHFYDDSFVSDDISTHYINLGYEVYISKIELNNVPKVQHNIYKWFSKEELLNSNQVHRYVKDYFN